MPKNTNFEIITGTYEEYLLGYVFSSEDQSLTQSFASHDHSSSVRCLASYDNYLASGASDDRIIVYDLKARKEHCMLTHHQSTITSLAFTNNHSHVISASQDGSLAIIRVGNWQLEKHWEMAHKEGHIIDIALHSTGKLALTLGTNGTIRTWNLIKGRGAYIINLNTKCKDPKSLEKIMFAPDDTKFVLYGGKYTEIWSIEIGGVLQVVEHEERVTCCAWLDNSTLVVGYENGQLGTVNLESEKKKIKEGHNGRVKALQYFEGFIVTASSSGQIKVWTRKLKEIASIETGCRVTCLCISQLVGKWKKEEPDVEPDLKQVAPNRPVKRSVVIEVEESSDEESAQIVAAKKSKKKKVSSNSKVNQEVVNTTKPDKECQLSKKKKIKRKSSGNEASPIDNTEIVRQSTDKSIKENKGKAVGKDLKRQGKAKPNKKRKKNIID